MITSQNRNLHDAELWRRIFLLEEDLERNERERDAFLSLQYQRAIDLQLEVDLRGARGAAQIDSTDIEYVAADQACKMLKISRTGLYSLIYSGALMRYKRGGRLRFRQSDVLALINQRYIPTAWRQRPKPELAIA